MYHFEIFVFVILAFMHHVSTQYVHNLSNYTADYPREKILAAVSKDDSFRTMFGHVFSPNINLKIGEVQERNICPSKQITYIPTSGKTLSNTIKKIVNVEGYNQLVTVEICADDATPSIECKMPLGYRFICKTQYMTIRLVVYEDDNRLGVESFSIPAGCSCTYEYA